MGDRLRTRTERDDALEIPSLVLLIGDRAAVAVELVLAGPPAGSVPVGDDAVDSIRSEETVLDSLPQTVLVDGVAEIEVCIAIVVAQRSGGHAQLEGWFEVLEDL